jgi:hypothetical protein
VKLLCVVWQTFFSFSLTAAKARIMKKRIFIFFFIFLFGCLLSCNNDPVAHLLKKTENQTTQKEPKKIEDTKNQKLSPLLYELAISPDPDYFAKKHHILLENRRIRVYIFLEPSTAQLERIKMLKAHNIMIEKWSADMLKGLAPVDQLISLSEEPAVQFIRLPDSLIKTRDIRP